MPAKSLELKHTIKLIQELTTEIDEIELAIKSIMDSLHSPILSIPRISYRMGAMIIAEIGDFNRFDSADRLLAYAGMSPSTYQSGQLDGSHSHMEKRGSRYLQYALYNSTKLSVGGMNHLLPILLKSGLKASITTLLYPMLQRNLCA